MVTSNETGEVVIAHGSVDFCEATTISLVDDPRRTETCVAPRHVDTSRDIYFVLFSPNEQRGEGGCAARLTFPFCFLFPVEQTTSWTGHCV